MSNHASGLARFAHRIGRLKSTPRTGWLHRGVPPARTESVADHSFRVAALAWLASSQVDGLNRDRIIKLALLHDLAEVITGDFTPYDPESIGGLDPDQLRKALNQRHVLSPERKEAKRLAENAAIDELAADLAPSLADEVMTLWTELQKWESPEARFVKEIDILETYLQSREYLALDSGLPVASFAAEVAEAVTTPSLAALRDAITAMTFDDSTEPG